MAVAAVLLMLVFVELLLSVQRPVVLDFRSNCLAAMLLDLDSLMKLVSNSLENLL